MILKSVFKKSLAKTIVTSIVGTTTLFGLSAISPKTVEARPTPDYYCAQLNGVWTTWAKTNLGRTAMVRWKTTVNRQWTPRNRCIEVSKRLSRLSDNGWLNSVTSGVVNNQRVICGVRNTGDSCNNNNLLFTVNTGANPDYLIQQMFDLRARANRQVVELSGNRCFQNMTDYRNNVSGESSSTKTCIGKQMYYHVDNILNEIIEFEKEQGTIVNESQLTPVTK